VAEPQCAAAHLALMTVSRLRPMMHLQVYPSQRGAFAPTSPAVGFDSQIGYGADSRHAELRG
jgi:hypothetical protein